ncbi:MAG TPA: FkbM family methyltransferase [Bosea sp. (in: a-proteobacteria)]|jgi:FkbM family methyltransferase|uniref:FkbM family methyltransferase n=1 Tax=Bosea sp. (in: a-proteobacteria) TaxID=1871050 RepID=UPI002E1136BA|nr:FkbM family methyltransferase [Bosea sp. (in: a-proteobacteria)]
MNAALYPKGTAKALSRSLRVYHGDAARNAAMDALYGRFLRPGELAFDIGAHVGDRVSSFRRLGARVVALEPQPGPARVLRLIHGRDPQVTLVEAACGDHDGSVTLRINSANPTVSTASNAFIGAAHGAGGWEGQVWDHEIAVRCTTLDSLIARHGLPTLLKIDVEGFEAHVLAGLTRRVPAISFEFTTIQRDVAEACLALLETLGPYRFNVALGESQRLELGQFVSAEAMGSFLRALPHAANSGDVYAILES